MTGNTGSRGRSTSRRPINRRSVLKATGAGALVSLTGMAGCAGESGGDGGDGGGDGSGGDGGGGGDGGSTSGGGGDTVRVGVSAALSGPLSALGQFKANAIRMAVDDAQSEGDMNGMSVELVDVRDNQQNPPQAINHVESYADQEVDYVDGFLGGVMALPAGNAGLENEIIVHGQAAPLDVTGAECRPNVFAITQTIVQANQASVGYALENDLGSSVYQIANDNPWGNGTMAYNRDTIIPEHGAEEVGSAAVPGGTTSFDQYLTQAQSSGADLLELALDPPGYIAVLKAIESNGMLDDGLTVTMQNPTLAAGRAVSDIIADYEIYAAKSWDWQLESESSTQFLQNYVDRFDETPMLYAALAYAASRTILRGFGQAGTTEMDPVRKEIEGSDLTPQFWGVGETFRACDHRATLPPITMKGLPPEEMDAENDRIFQVVQKMSDPAEYMIPCEETGCDMPG